MFDNWNKEVGTAGKVALVCIVLVVIVAALQLLR